MNKSNLLPGDVTSGCVFVFFLIANVLEDSANPDQMPRSVASDLSPYFSNVHFRTL